MFLDGLATLPSWMKMQLPVIAMEWTTGLLATGVNLYCEMSSLPMPLTNIFFSFTIFLYLSSYRMLSTLSILAACRTRVT